MKMTSKSTRKTAKRRVVLTERDLSTIHGGKKATKKATKSVVSEPVNSVIDAFDIEPS